MAEPLLQVERVSHRFGGLMAVNAASLAAAEGRITALIGPNGAGKTTLFALIAGFLKPSAGTIRYGGKDVTGEAPYRADLPDRPVVWRLDGARQYPGRRVSAPRRARPGAGDSRASRRRTWTR